MELRDRILAKRPRQEPVDREGWEGVYVREMPANARKQVAEMAEADDGLERLVQLACVDESGESVFSEDDLAAIGELPIAELNEVVRVFNDVNGFSENGRKALGKDSSLKATAISRSA